MSVSVREPRSEWRFEMFLAWPSVARGSRSPGLNGTKLSMFGRLYAPKEGTEDKAPSASGQQSSQTFLNFVPFSPRFTLGYCPTDWVLKGPLPYGEDWAPDPNPAHFPS